MRYRVNLPLEVVFFDAKRDFAPVTVGRGKWPMGDIDAAFGTEFEKDDGPWIAITGTATGLSFTALGKLQANLKSIGLDLRIKVLGKEKQKQ
ncbi:MAG: hypothetical protein AB200_02795 [Parcubacteria bacterium C7867-005]|nr:MAG: hypothetical protein AB200_02795 [Parcubacteria bacterium C7867-005]